MIDPWYPDADEYYVAAGSDEYPVRQGDLFGPSDELTDAKGRPWIGFQVVHPSCEIVAKEDPSHLQVVRIRLLSSVSQKHQDSIARGYSTTEEGVARVAWAHTYFLPPVGSIVEPAFSDFRSIGLVSRERVTADARIAALTHDARVTFIRRKLYWEQRWLLVQQQVRDLEAARIRSDAAFVGPRPAWAS